MKLIASLIMLGLVASCAIDESTLQQNSDTPAFCGNPPYYTCQPGSYDNCAEECQWSNYETGYCPDYTSGEYFHCLAVGYEVWSSGPWTGLYRCYNYEPASPMRCISGYPP